VHPPSVAGRIAVNPDDECQERPLELTNARYLRTLGIVSHEGRSIGRGAFRASIRTTAPVELRGSRTLRLRLGGEAEVLHDLSWIARTPRSPARWIVVPAGASRVAQRLSHNDT
jgi:hypothetical protein